MIHLHNIDKVVYFKNHNNGNYNTQKQQHFQKSISYKIEKGNKNCVTYNTFQD